MQKNTLYKIDQTAKNIQSLKQENMIAIEQKDKIIEELKQQNYAIQSKLKDNMIKYQ